MTGLYKNEDLRDMFGVSHETIRKYTIDFSDFLSDGANPPEGKHRVYNESDLRVFAVIVSMKASNHTHEDIKATLRAGRNGELEGLLNDNSPVLSPPIERMMARQEIQNLKNALELAETEAQTWRDVAQEQKGRIAELQRQVEQFQKQAETSQSQSELISLHREIARLTVLLEIAQNKSGE